MIFVLAYFRCSALGVGISQSQVETGVEPVKGKKKNRGSAAADKSHDLLMMFTCCVPAASALGIMAADDGVDAAAAVFVASFTAAAAVTCLAAVTVAVNVAAATVGHIYDTHISSPASRRGRQHTLTCRRLMA